MIDIKQAVMNGASALDANKFDYNREDWGNASELFGCIRRQWYQRNEPSSAAPQNWGFARRGIHGEKYLVASMKAANMPTLFMGEDQKTLQDAKRKISCTPDGALSYDNETIPVEFKTIDPRKRRDKLPSEQHRKQLQIAMEMMEPDINRPINFGLLIYMDASNFDDIIQFEIPRDPTILVAAERRAQKKLRTKNVDMLDREGKASDECRYCPFTEICGVKKNEGLEGRTRSNRGSSLAVAVDGLMAAKEMEERVKKDKAEWSENIKQELLKRKTMQTTVGDYDVTLQSVKGRTSLDKKGVAAAGIDLTPFEKVGPNSERLIVKMKDA